MQVDRPTLGGFHCLGPKIFGQLYVVQAISTGFMVQVYNNSCINQQHAARSCSRPDYHLHHGVALILNIVFTPIPSRKNTNV